MTASPTPLRTAFDPEKHLSRVNGGEYLKVEHRLAWLRDRDPEAVLTTELVEWSGAHAIFRAEVRLTTGGCATGYGSETAEDFRDYLEKAETKAIGRALAALGFGTQFARDHEDGAPRRTVDAPVRIEERRGAPSRAEASPAPASPDRPTPRQAAYLQSVARQDGLSPDALVALSIKHFGAEPAALNRVQMSALITLLQTGELPR